MISRQVWFSSWLGCDKVSNHSEKDGAYLDPRTRIGVRLARTRDKVTTRG